MGGILMSAEFDFVETKIEVGLSVIEASAGTGKTYAISHLVPRLLLDGSAGKLSEILLVTFTNDAARELSDRVRKVLEKLSAAPDPDEETKDNGLHRLRKKYGTEKITATIGQALLDLDLLGVSTIHSFCQRTLQTEGTLCGLPVIPELIPSDGEIIEHALHDLWETRIASDLLLTLLSFAGAWDLSADLNFIASAIPISEAEFLPSPRDFDDVLSELRSYPARFDDAVCKELQELLSKEIKWTGKAPSEEERQRIPSVLRDSNSLEAPGFLDAVRGVASASDWINGTSNKAIKAAVGTCVAVTIASELCEVLHETGWHFRIKCLQDVRTEVADALSANRQITYNGLITTLQHALQGPQADALSRRLRERYKVALIDESQDTDPRQFEIFQRVFLDAGESRLVLIGDPKQAIYAFRGADVNTYLRARDLAGENVFSLRRTFRAPENLVRATNALFSRSGSLLKEKLDFQPASSGLKEDIELQIEGEPAGPRIEAWIAADGGDEYSNVGKRNSRIPGAVATEIVRLLNARVKIVSGGSSEEVRPGHFAVLVSSGYEAGAVAKALKERAVPAIRAGGDDIMTTEDATELLAVLRALNDPRRSSLRLAALATRLMGCDASALLAIREDPEEVFLEKFIRWQTIWHREGIAAALAQLDKDEKLTLRLAALDQGERTVTNLRQLTDLLQSASLEFGNKPGQLLRWFGQEIAGAEGRSDAEERQQQLESDADSVQIVTMHSAKGLEYPLVFCPFLWPSKLPQGVQKLTLPNGKTHLVETDLVSDASVAASIQRASLEDRLRLAYVAITRARVKVWIYGGELCGSKRPPASALDWLLRSEDQQDFEQWKQTAGSAGRGARHTAGLAALTGAGEAEGLISWGPPPEPAEDKWKPNLEVKPRPLSALATPAIPEAWGMTSFSSLTREKTPHAPSETLLAAKAAEPATEPNLFFAAPGGAMMGTAIHAWIEQWDFSEVLPVDVKAHLDQYALPQPATPPALHERVSGMLENLSGALLPGLECTVRDACSRREASEWHFQLPISHFLSSHSLAGVFAAHGQSRYASMLSALPVEELQGYLHGFLDRIAFFEGSWGVIDWKTNNLGSTPEAYTEPSLLECAMDSHYLLQTHLYLVALRRYLGPQAKIAGAWLVFLRGISEGSSNGILHIHPQNSLMSELDTLFSRPQT